MQKVMKILVATEKPFAPVAVEGIRRVAEEAGFTLELLEKYTDRAQLLTAVSDADALIVRSDKIGADVFAAAPRLKVVVRAGAGYDNIDLAAATTAPPAPSSAANASASTPSDRWAAMSPASPKASR